MVLIQSLPLWGLIKWASHIPKMIYYFMCESALKPAQDKHGPDRNDHIRYMYRHM